MQQPNLLSVQPPATQPRRTIRIKSLFYGQAEEQQLTCVGLYSWDQIN